jgi:hypothetical protein
VYFAPFMGFDFVAFTWCPGNGSLQGSDAWVQVPCDQQNRLGAGLVGLWRSWNRGGSQGDRCRRKHGLGNVSRLKAMLVCQFGFAVHCLLA